MASLSLFFFFFSLRGLSIFSYYFFSALSIFLPGFCCLRLTPLASVLLSQCASGDTSIACRHIPCSYVWYAALGWGYGRHNLSGQGGRSPSLINWVAHTNPNASDWMWTVQAKAEPSLTPKRVCVSRTDKEES